MVQVICIRMCEFSSKKNGTGNKEIVGYKFFYTQNRIGCTYFYTMVLLCLDKNVIVTVFSLD